MVMSRTSTRYDGDICSTTTISVVLLLRIQSKVASKIDNNITVPGEVNVMCTSLELLSASIPMTLDQHLCLAATHKEIQKYEENDKQAKHDNFLQLTKKSI